ncbi:HD domain-containing protein [Stetteria hydrogenophila]
MVGPRLVETHIASSPLLARAWSVLTSDPEVSALLHMSNVNAVSRLLYNDHGPVHARIVAGSALEIFELLASSGVEFDTIKSGTASSVEEAKLIVLLAAYLHDIGNSVHRVNHELIGALLARGILYRLLPQIMDGRISRRIHLIVAEVMNAIYSTAMDVPALTIEAGIVKVADATDMAEGRARYPYRKGKSDIHALSALAVKKVELARGEERPVRITVYMTDTAGFFQIEKVLLPKLESSPLKSLVEIQPVVMEPRGYRRISTIKLG